jgi:hypothetical protein
MTVSFCEGKFITSGADGSVAVWDRDGLQGSTTVFRYLGMTPAEQMLLSLSSSLRNRTGARRSNQGSSHSIGEWKRRIARQRSLLLPERVQQQAISARAEISSLSREYRRGTQG